MALGWGIIATWWVGAFLGFLLAIAARAGSRRKLEAPALLRPIAILLATMAVCAAMSAVTGFILTRRGIIAPPDWVASMLRRSEYARFTAAWFSHTMSYAVGFIGGIVLCVIQFRKRSRRITTI